MIELMFEFGNEAILIVINRDDIKFGNTAFGAQLADISGLKLDYPGVCRQFPDLEANPDWESEATLRFKEYLLTLKTEEERCNYIIEELEGCGYKAKSKRRKGHRPIQL